LVRWNFSTDEATARGVERSEDMEVYGYAPLQITFDEPEPPLQRPVLGLLDDCLTYVRELISAIAQAGGFI
jgi:hypothetical protein